MEIKPLKMLTIGAAMLLAAPIAQAAEGRTKLASLQTEKQAATPVDMTLPVKERATQWITSFIRTVAPPGRKVYYPEGQETAEEAEERYTSIAHDLIDVIYDPDTTPIFKGENGRSQTVAVVLSVMFHESSFMKHVDFGIGKYSRGDGGKSWCMMQLRIGDGRTLKWNRTHDRPVAWNDPSSEIFEGYKGEDLIADRKVCIREGLKILRLSFGGTQGLPLQDRLRVYASGDREHGSEASHNRMRLAMSWFGRSFHNQFTDEEVMAVVTAEKKRSPEGAAQRDPVSIL